MKKLNTLFLRITLLFLFGAIAASTNAATPKPMLERIEPSMEDVFVAMIEAEERKAA